MKHYYLIGIGGISMSGIAKILHFNGDKVSGSDIKKSEITDELEKMGIKVFIGHSAKNIDQKFDAVIFTSAATATPDAPAQIEIKAAKELGIPLYKRSEFIGQLMADKFGIVISGMHGKTTTTAMAGFILKKLGLKPTVMLGGDFKEFNHRNLEIGQGKYFVVEGCEYDHSFLDFKFQAGIILNIEPEHLDYYSGGLPQIIKTFQKFVKLIPEDGILIANRDDKNVMQVVKEANCKVVYFSKNDLENYKLNLAVPGDHNKMDAIAVIKLVEHLGLNVEKAKKILFEFCGAKRRLEILGKKNGTIFIDDYAHHPTEIAASYQAILEKYPHSKILIIFQPHQYSRTKLLFNDFVEELLKIENLALVEVYEVAGREDDEKIGSQNIIQALNKKQKKVIYFKDYQDAIDYLKKHYPKYDIIVTMGAGPINTVSEYFVK
jgi:UDP-N-acetylmuramate--alanine ligase